MKGYDFFGDSRDVPLEIRDLKTVITPHPGEAAKFLGIKTEEVQKDRPAAARWLCSFTNAVVVLKGHGTVVANSVDEGRLTDDLTRTLWDEDLPCDLLITRCGNVALARGGSGDVLAGLIGSQLAHRELGDWEDSERDYGWKSERVMTAVKNAVLAHGQAADELVKEHGIRGVRPRELAATAGKILSDMAYRLR